MRLASRARARMRAGRVCNCLLNRLIKSAFSSHHAGSVHRVALMPLINRQCVSQFMMTLIMTTHTHTSKTYNFSASTQRLSRPALPVTDTGPGLR